MRLRAENLVKQYKKRRVVNDMSLEVQQGEIVGLLGPNGAGKTTTFYMTVGLVKPDEGEVYLDDEKITSLAMYQRAQLGVGYLPQEASVFRDLSVEDNILAVLELTNKSKEEQIEKTESLISEFGLEKVRKNLGKVLSGEEKIWDFWAKNWWAGDPKDRVTRIRSFQKSLDEYEKTLPTTNDDTAMVSPVDEGTSFGTKVASFFSSLSPIRSASADVFDDIEQEVVDIPITTPEQANDITTNVVQMIAPVANTNTVPEEQQLVVGQEAPAEMVGDMVLSKNPADVAIRYLGMSEDSEIGAEVIRRYFDNVVGDWNPDNESVKDFAKNKAWCAAFLTQVLRDSGVDTKELTGSDDPFNQIRAASYVNAGTGVETSQAQTGDIMVKMHSPEERKKYKLGVAHVGIVVKVEGNQVWFIGGNTGDKVEVSSYNLDEADVKIRRVTKADDIPEAQNVPWLWQLRAGKAYRKSSDKLRNFFFE